MPEALVISSPPLNLETKAKTKSPAMFLEQLSSSRRLVAIISSEYRLNADINFADLKHQLIKAGFYAVETDDLGCRLTYQAYLNLLTKVTEPVINASCPAMVRFIQRYATDLIPHLATIVSPVVAQAKLVKQMYPSNIQIVVISSCPARQIEIDKHFNSTEVMSLKLEELEPCLPKTVKIKGRANSHNLAFKNSETGKNSNLGTLPTEESPTLFSATGRSVKVINCQDLRSQIFEPFLWPSTFGCQSCLLQDPNYLAKLQSSFHHKEEIDMLSGIPKVDLSCDFAEEQLENYSPSEAEVEQALIKAGFNGDQDFLNCGSCGYPTCYQNAIAVLKGMTDWSLCFPKQQQYFQQINQQLKELTTTDSLTGLTNHRGFIDRLKKEFSRVIRYSEVLSLAMIDVDSFKRINDTYGHLEGDKILKLISQILLHNLRETDIPARYGGDEFAIILPETNKTEAFAVAEKLRAKVEKAAFYVADEIREKLSLSVGIYGVTGKERDFMEIISKADAAMYQAKKDGRNCTRIAASKA
jgi:diguanylate cyclase (GGDEF)-like protein